MMWQLGKLGYTGSVVLREQVKVKTSAALHGRLDYFTPATSLPDCTHVTVLA